MDARKVCFWPKAVRRPHSGNTCFVAKRWTALWPQIGDLNLTYRGDLCHHPGYVTRGIYLTPNRGVAGARRIVVDDLENVGIGLRKRRTREFAAGHDSLEDGFITS